MRTRNPSLTNEFDFMIKFLGLLCLFMTFSWGGHLMAKREKDRIDAAEGMLFLIRTIRQNISFFRTQLSQIYRNFSHHALNDSNFSAILRQKGLKEAYLANQERFGFDSFTENRILAFADQVGKLPLEEQLASCDMICNILEEKLHEAKQAFPNKRKLYHVLGISFGCGIVILFL